MRMALVFVAGAALFALEGCGSTLAQPFDSMKSAPITLYRLQNFEPPAQQATATAALPFQLPAEIQQWVQAGAALLPPGLLPAGLLPGSQPAATAQSQQARFHNFLILGAQLINDTKQHDELLDLLGHPANFVAQHDNCMYAEFGISIAQLNGAPADDILVSLSCDQMQPADFQWPYANTGIPAASATRFVGVVQKTFGGT